MARTKLWLFISLLTAICFLPIACDFGDDDDDDDNNDDDNNDDNDDNDAGDDDDNCVEEAFEEAAEFCHNTYGLEAGSSAGLETTLIECDFYCGNTDYYYDSDCREGTCICCI